MIRQLVYLALCLHVAWAQCDSQNCKLPNCQCIGQNPPGGLAVKDTPQLVFLTFSEAINVNNYKNYTAILGNRVNPNGCPISMTFFVTHQNNDYPFTYDLYYKGNEMASETVTHKTPVDLWKNMTTSEAVQEIGEMADMLQLYAKIPKTSVTGYRAPFLQTSSDMTFRALQQLGLQYDFSFPTNKDNLYWPYTLDYGMQHECVVGECPTGNYPGYWMVPMNMLNGLDDLGCAMTDACFKPENASRTFDFLKNNFDRSYNGNRAPVGISLHSAWFQGWKYTLDGYIQFLDYIQKFQDVYIVSVSKGLAWMKNPVPVSQAGSSSAFACPAVQPPGCQARNCYYTNEDGVDVIMRSCTSCPPNYPWLGNVQGN